jgi:hypothetical protein
MIIATLMGITKIKYRNVTWESVDSTITPTGMLTSAPQTNNDYPLWELLPYAGEGFVVDRYIEPLVLGIKTNIDKETVTQLVYFWMTENKVATESHKLIFEKQ